MTTHTPGVVVHVCVPLKNRGGHLRAVLPSWRAWHDASGPIRLVVADFGSDDINLDAVLIASGVPSRIARCTGHFARSVALDAAAQMSYAHADEILFFLDADVIVADPGFGSVLRDRVRPGQVYLPVVYGLNQGRPAVIDGNAEGDRIDQETGRRANGFWRDRGFGMVGITRGDYAHTGGWSLAIRRWGGEDDDLAYRCRSAGLTIIREHCPALVHRWHPRDEAYLNRHADPDATRVRVQPFKE